MFVFGSEPERQPKLRERKLNRLKELLDSFAKLAPGDHSNNLVEMFISELAITTCLSSGSECLRPLAAGDPTYSRDLSVTLHKGPSPTTGPNEKEKFVEMILPEDCSFELKMLHSICTSDTRSRILNDRRDNVKTVAEVFRDSRLELALQNILLFADKADGQAIDELHVNFGSCKTTDERLLVDKDGWIDQQLFMDAWNKKWTVKQEQTINSFLDKFKQSNRPIMKALIMSAQAINEKQQVEEWLTSLGLQHVIAQLQQCSLTTMKKLRDADAPSLKAAGCTDDDVQVFAAAAAATAAA